jgi:hypothetical protein
MDYKTINESNAPQFYDEEKGIRYEFLEHHHITYQEKLRLIASQGSPRKKPIEEDAKLTKLFGWAEQIFEAQTIYRDQLDPQPRKSQ